VSGPVERAEERPRGDRGVAGAERSLPHAVRDERAHAALVAIALGDNHRAQPGRQGIHLEVGRRSLDFVHETSHMCHGQGVETAGERGGVPACGRQRLQQPIERAVLTEEQELVLAAEVVIEVAGREVGGHGDLAHPRGGEPSRPEDVCGRAQDLDATRVGAALRATGAVGLM
jgi:hypothetical protein